MVLIKHNSYVAKLHSEIPTNYQRSIGIFLALLFFLLPVILNPFGYNMFASIRAAFLYVVAALMILLILVDSFSKGQFRIKKSPLNVLIIIFAAAVTLSTTVSVHISTSVFGHIWRYEGLFSWFSYITVFFAVLYAIKTRAQQVLLLYALMVSAWVISLYGIAQHFGIDFISWAADQDLTRSISTLGGPTYLGGYLVLLLPLALVISFSTGHPLKLKAISLFSSVLMILALLFTFARSAWLAFLVSLLFLFMLNFMVIIRKKYLVTLLIVALLVGFLLLSTGKLNPYIERARSSFNMTRGSSGGIRLLAWKQTAEMIKDRPLLGWGPETYSLIFPRYITVEWEQTVRRDFPTDKAHNDLLHIAATMGLLVVIPYVLIFILFFWESLKSIRWINDPGQKNLLKGFSAGIIAYLVQLQFNFNVVDITPIFWGLMGMSVSISLVSLNRKDRVVPLPFRITRPIGSKIALATLFLAVFVLSILAVRPVVADTYFRKGLEALQTGNPEAAVSALSKASFYDAKEPYYAQRLGQIYTKLFTSTGDKSYFFKAVEVLCQAQRINSLNEYTYLYLGDAYLAGAEALKQEDLLDLAAANYRKVLASDPNFAQAHLSLGITYAQMNMTEKAINEWKTVPNLYPAADAAYYNLGVAYEQMGNIAEARNNFSKAVEINPSCLAAREAINRLQRHN